MPRIFDNINAGLLPALREALALADRSDFCVGYFNLRGWKKIDDLVERFAGVDDGRCRLLVGMTTSPALELRQELSVIHRGEEIDKKRAVELRMALAREFRDQLATGLPSGEDEDGLRRLARQIRTAKLQVKLYTRHSLHAKLYLAYRADPLNPRIAFVGSSNLTFAGLAHQGELNVDVLEHDGTAKLAAWFEDRWNDNFCIDISAELLEILDTSWAREELVPPYLIYLKMAYHLAQEARAGLTEFQIPKDFGNRLLRFQVAAVKIAAHHLNRRGGVMLGDVVGLGKTLMACALARIFEDDHNLETLILCPKNLVPMWQDHTARYRMRARVVSMSRIDTSFMEFPRHRLLIVDESHNLRSREGRRWSLIRDYIERNECKVVLLSATPYNKQYTDLSNQLRLFIPGDQNLGIRPERLLREMSEEEFIRKHQCGFSSLDAFDKSEHPEDWRELMRLFLVRRTRSFIIENYAETEAESGRKYLTFEDGNRSYFPKRTPKRVQFEIDEQDPEDPYARLYSDRVVETIGSLKLPRYGLLRYLRSRLEPEPAKSEQQILDDLSRAGRRLLGFCRTNLFKRLESSGHSFLSSIERHILRNLVFVHALESGAPLPLGAQDSTALDSRMSDREDLNQTLWEDEETTESSSLPATRSLVALRHRAVELYDIYRTRESRRYRWLATRFFLPSLIEELLSDSASLLEILELAGDWSPERDRKLEALENLLARRHGAEKVLVFSQFADTVDYLREELRKRGLDRLAGVTGNSENPTAAAWRFSPVSNEKRGGIAVANELRVLLATDVLSEGQNLQDARIVVNFDLPWAIIRLIQRVGRVDRIGQKAEEILCYTFMPADGVERLIRLRAKLRQRLRENAEVVGTDEAFFDDDRNDGAVRDLYSEKSGILDAADEGEVDLASYAFQIWQNALKADPLTEKLILELPDVVYATRAVAKNLAKGVLLYLRTADDTDALGWVDAQGALRTSSPLEILEAARCTADEQALPRRPDHHDLLARGVETLVREARVVGGSLGRPSGARFRAYSRLKAYRDRIRGTLFFDPALDRVLDEIYRLPLREAARDALNRQLKAGLSDEDLAKLVLALREENRLTIAEEEAGDGEPRILCSLGLTD